MNIKTILSENLGIKKLTGPALTEAVISRYDLMSDKDKRLIAREIAYFVIGTSGPSKNTIKHHDIPHPRTPDKTNVLGINHIGPLDVTVEWKTLPDGTLSLAGYRIDAGGDQVNVSKVFSHFNENIALVALTGTPEGAITKIWKNEFLSSNITAYFISSIDEDQPVAVYNMVDGNPIPGMFGWADELSKKTVEKINTKALSVLDTMLEHDPDNIWMVISAGGPVRYNRGLAYYSSLVNQVKEKYGSRVQFLIDFKFMSGPEEALSVLDIPRFTPQDIIKPNMKEFLQILETSGLAEKGLMDGSTITEKTVKQYAIKLREKYNLMGVLVSMDKSGLMLVMQDKVIREKGIKIRSACHTAAGDSLKAGFVYALSNGRSFEEAVHTGNVFGASTASMEGSLTVTPEVFNITETLARRQNVSPEVEYL